MKIRINILTLASFILLANCTNKKEQKNESFLSKAKQTEVTDSNKIYEVWEVDEPPLIP